MADATHESEIPELRRRLEEAEETLRAIRSGEVDALVVEGAGGNRVFTLQGADLPYRALIEAMHQGAVCLSGDGTVLYCNRCFADMVRRPHEKVIGAAVAEFFPPSHRALFEAMVHGGRSRRVKGELPIQAADGSLLPVYLAIAPLPLTEAEALCMVVTDLTDQKKREDLQEADRRKDEFLAMLAHELRNPLAPMRNALQIMRLAGDNAQAVELAKDVMDRQLRHMVRLVDDLLDVSRITSGKIELRKERVDLARVIQSAVETSRPLIEASGHELTVQLAPEPIWLEADLTRLAQVVSNLLNNSARYTKPNGHIGLTTERRHGEAVVRVRDNGIGIPKDMLPHVFEIFTQVNRPLEGSQGGLGIGLSLVRGLVEMHGGKVEAYSDGPGRGSEFVVRLPLSTEKPERQDVQAPDGNDEKVTAPSARRILIVEDNRDAADSLALLLELMGNNVRTVYDGASALEAATAYRPDVVLLDIGLPERNGYEVAREIRASPQLKGVVLIAQTGWGQEEDHRRTKEAGFDHHLVKPVDPQKLQELLASVPSIFD
jgi:PAS domain S-box-containing protein